MTRLPPTAVDKAKAEAEQWESFRDSAAWAVAVLVPTIADISGETVATICGAAAASMIMLGSKKARLAKRKAEDPPDLEGYRRPVVARRGHFNEDAFGGSALERATV